MKLKKLASLALAGTLTLGLLPAFSSPALAADGDTSTYTLTIPSALTVANSGWNATDGISATGTLESGKKLTVTAASANSWALMSGDNSVGYKMATTSADTTATTSWEFKELNSTATTKPMGIIVEDYSSKPAGTYQDTVTFTAKVGNAVKTVTWENPIKSFIGTIIDGESRSKDGVTVKALNGMVDGDMENAFMGVAGGNSFQFSVASGNITKIEITTSFGSVENGNGWSSNVWTGKANTVNFGQYFTPTKIVFTIEE